MDTTQSSTGLAQTSSTTYAYRKSILKKEERYTLESEGLRIEEEGKPAQQIRYSDIQRVHLRFQRSKYNDTYQCRLKTASNGEILLQSTHFASFASFEDRSAAYAPFVVALHERLRGYPGIQYAGGTSWIFALTWAMTVVCVVALLVSLVFGQFFLAIAFAFLTYRLATTISRMKPRDYTPTALPVDLLPSV